MNRIAVIGAGYVGLTTAACFAHLGHEVVCADIDRERVERLQRGELPIVEAGLANLLTEGLRSGRPERWDWRPPPVASFIGGSDDLYEINRRGRLDARRTG